ncbi:hypothetical protein HY635_00770 [Candidatus Uhrbacteria bacterium]|nr:hypothetical protein [Candidatus Uhrbacteria bacterium]
MLQPSLFTDYPSVIRRFLIGAVALLVLGGIGYRVAAIIAPPILSVRQPADQLSTSSRIITISGATEPGALLTINGETFIPDTSGAFTTDVVLLPGVNTIAIEARRRHGWTARVERRIHVRAADAPIALDGKFEARNPKFETNPNNRMIKI